MLKAQYTRQEVVGQYQENILASLPGTSINIIKVLLPVIKKHQKTLENSNDSNKKMSGKNSGNKSWSDKWLHSTVFLRN